MIAWVLLVAGLLIVIPQFKRTFEEYEIDLPVLCELAFAISNRMVRYWYVFLPIVVSVVTAAEMGILAMPCGKTRLLLNTVYWLALLAAFGFLSVAIGSPYIALTSGLSGG